MGVYLFGGWDAILKALITLVAIDFVTGVLAAYTEKKLNSGVGYKGIIRKVCIFLMVAVAQIIDTSSGLGEPLLRTAVIMFFIANESLSAIENMGKMGVPLPEPLKAALEKLHGRRGSRLALEQLDAPLEGYWEISSIMDGKIYRFKPHGGSKQEIRIDN